MWLFSGLKNSKGFSLIEVMVAAGIMVIISMGITQVMVNAAIQERSLQIKQAGREFHDELAEVISDDNCGATNISEVLGASLTGTNGLIERADSDFINNGLTTDAALEKNTFNIELNGPGLGSVIVNDTFDNKKIKIESIQLRPFKSIDDTSTVLPSYEPIGDGETAATATNYKAQIEVTYSGKIGGQDSVSRRSRHPVVLTMHREKDDSGTTTAAYISSCRSLSNVNTLRDLCGAMENGWWSDDEVKCYVCEYQINEDHDACKEQEDDVGTNSDATTSNWLDMNNSGNAPDNYKN